MTEYVGRLSDLSAEGDIARRKSGNVRIKYIDDNGKKQVARFILNSEDYSLAVDAHKLGKHVRIVSEEGDQPGALKCVNIEIL